MWKSLIYFTAGADNSIFSKHFKEKIVFANLCKQNIKLQKDGVTLGVFVNLITILSIVNKDIVVENINSEIQSMILILM